MNRCLSNKLVILCLSVKTVLGNIFCSPKKIHYLWDSPDFSQLGQQCHFDNNEVWIIWYIFILLLKNVLHIKKNAFQ